MLNLVLHITLPSGIRLVNSQVLSEPVTFDILSACDPFYASVDQVKISGGPLLRRLQDITIACAIYNQSQQCNDLLLHKPTGSGDDAIRFRNAQNQWVQATTARQLLLSVTSGAGGAPSSHVLANFSVTKGKGFESEGTPALLADLRTQISQYTIVLRSGGKAAPGGHVKPTMGAKGVMDWQEHTPGRTWLVTGMGANESSPSGIGGTGGRGKSVKFFGSPMFGGTMFGCRSGIWQSGFSLSNSYTTGFDSPLFGAGI
jgi:hypothetical protein